MAHDPKALQALLESIAPPGLELGFRSMFGGVMGYANGQPFASLSDMGLAFKFKGADHAAVSALPGVRPLRYAPDQPASKTYLLVPDDMLSDDDALRSWMTRSAAGVASNANKPRTIASKK